MSDNPFAQSAAPGGTHHQLAALVGEWVGTTRTWFEPGQLADESPTHGMMRLILDGRFLLHEYAGTLRNEPLQGLALYGFNLQSGLYEVSWIDSAHMGSAIMYATGARTAQGFAVLGHYPDGQGGPLWGWRTEIALLAPDHLLITAYNIAPSGAEAKAVETDYARRR